MGLDQELISLIQRYQPKEASTHQAIEQCHKEIERMHQEMQQWIESIHDLEEKYEVVVDALQHLQTEYQAKIGVVHTLLGEMQESYTQVKQIWRELDQDQEDRGELPFAKKELSHKLNKLLEELDKEHHLMEHVRTVLPEY